MIVHESRNPAFRRPFGAVKAGERVYLAAEKENMTRAELILRRFTGEEERLPMTREGDGRFSVTLTMPAEPCVLWYSVSDGTEETCQWQITVYAPAPVLDWWKNAVVYQIFPDRFARERDWTPREPAERKGAHRFLLRDWAAPPFYPRDEENRVSAWPFWGGTLKGIEEKLPYLASLGVTVLYLCPIFEACSSHRYDTGDYFRIDPLLGTEEDFVSLCRSAGERGMHVVLDGVFNHTGADSRYFDKFGNYGTGDQYRRWFRFGEGYTHGYECWWDVPDLPDIEENEPSYREFLCGEQGVVRHWLRKGASGWRLDVADELPDSLIREIRSAMKTEKSDSLLLGEVWEDASCKVSYGELREYFLGRELDAAMHYPFRTATLSFLRGETDAREAAEALWSIREHYPPEHQLSALNLIGSHDRERALTALSGDRALLRLWLAMMFCFPGVPCIYYGDEAGMTGGADPYNRGSFPWDKKDELTDYIRELTVLYREHDALRNGDTAYDRLSPEALVCRRWNEREEITAVFNRGELPVEYRGETVPAKGWKMFL